MNDIRFYKPGDVIDLGGGVTWRLSDSLASSLNRDICQRDRVRLRKASLA